MATSGSIDLSVTALSIINKAFSKVGVKKQEQALQPAELEDGLDALNFMIKAWQAQRLHLWAKTEGVLFLDVGVTDYQLGVGGDEATTFDDFVSTETTIALVASDVIVPVTSTAGMTTGDFAGIKLDDGTRQWTTLTVDSAVQVTLATGATSAVASGNSLFTFTSLIERPLRILSVRNAKISTDSEFEILQLARNEYFNQSNKTSQGSVVNYYYSPQLGTGRFYVWPTASSVDDFIRFTFERSLEDFDVTANNPDFPIEWTETLIWNLAARLSVDYNVPLAKQQMISAAAGNFLDDLLGYDEEPSSINIQPSFD